MRILPIIFISLLLAGCNILPKTAAVHDLGIPPTYPAKNEKSSDQPVIAVEAPKWLYDSRIRYRLLYSSPTQVGFYTLDRWLAPPPELFEQLLTASKLEHADTVTVRLLEFEQQFTGPAQAQVVMRFEVKASTINHNKEKTHEFRLQEICPAPNAKGAVTAYSNLARKAAQIINEWLKS